MNNFATACVLSTALLLGGCSGLRIVDSDVNAFTTPAAQAMMPPARYRFERLPSQQAQPQQSERLEALVEEELAKVGLQRDDQAAQYSIQVERFVIRDPEEPWEDSRYIEGFVSPYPVIGPYGTVLYNPSLKIRLIARAYFRREVGLVMRRLSDNSVVYETRAKHDGVWSDDEAVLPAMFRAALRDFPNSPQGPRRVIIEIAR